MKKSILLSIIFGSGILFSMPKVEAINPIIKKYAFLSPALLGLAIYYMTPSKNQYGARDGAPIALLGAIITASMSLEKLIQKL